MQFLPQAPTDRHTTLEDLQGIVTGVTMVALSVQFLQAAELITGQIAGLSLVASYPTGLSFGLVFFLLNLPFYVFAILQIGWRFTLRTFLAVALLSALVELMPRAFSLSGVHPGAAAVLAGISAGVGLLVLFRHGATLGGVGILALWLQDRTTLRAGQVQLGFDLVVFTLALFLLPLATVLWSLLGAVILNVIILTNHRRDRYIASS
ncbi:YitT family protein [Poseidonocella sedimentorum]|uniref:Uncharacterized membrane-anchored protein YitT, contains DUF161 and DUF2179 domains n=1 Tax=Poseidonocella sedimentorum TaxID=871652 RepID=A0A1I6EP54_9RHOB|nr:YitT family protein [Poseidonocella sedimentorum]SFR19500.1 Uncharacterized membrane-anchored protein YitT, contains DUF161 and DUF2179 domains [Poseidonocella sedimentorum]